MVHVRNTPTLRKKILLQRLAKATFRITGLIVIRKILVNIHLHNLTNNIYGRAQKATYAYIDTGTY